MFCKVPIGKSLRGCGTTTWPAFDGCLYFRWSPLPPAQYQPALSSRLIISLLVIGNLYTPIHTASTGKRSECEEPAGFRAMIGLKKLTHSGGRFSTSITSVATNVLFLCCLTGSVSPSPAGSSRPGVVAEPAPEPPDTPRPHGESL